MIRNIRLNISLAWILVLFLPTLSSGQDQSKKYRVSCVGFYNLENLYDTVDDPEKSDEEFLPNGTKRYTEE
ncbi:MAG: endonuclease/exonuclease/phosphatase family protein, partial [Bacteroidota bacterium]